MSVKLLDWGEEGHRSDAEIASLRAAFTQEVAVWHKLDHPNVTKVTEQAYLILTILKSLISWKCFSFERRPYESNRWIKILVIFWSVELLVDNVVLTSSHAYL